MDVEVGPLSPIFNSVLSPPIAPVVNKKRGRGRGKGGLPPNQKGGRGGAK